MFEHGGLTNLVRDERGVITLSFILCFGVMLLGTLVSLDIIRYNVAQTRLWNALDAATISAGRKLEKFHENGSDGPGAAWVQDAKNYFRANMPNGFLGSDIDAGDIDVAYSRDKDKNGKYERIDMSASGKLPLFSAAYIKQDFFGLNAKNAAVRRARTNMEIAMALDNSGSMTDHGRIGQLKSSANDLVDTLMGASVNGTDDVDVRHTYIGLVPFTDTVNLGAVPSMRSWLSNDLPADLERFLDSQWYGCIAEPLPPVGGWTIDNPLPATALYPGAGFVPLMSTYSYRYVPKVGYLVPYSADADVQLLAPSARYKDRRVAAGFMNATRPQAIWINLAFNSDYCTQSRTRFLTQDADVLRQAIDDMQANGGTNIPTGLLWAWRMISPNWAGAWDASRPELPRGPDSYMTRIIVLLSDGDNESIVRRASVPIRDNARVRLSYRYVPCKKWSGSRNHRTCVDYGTTAQTVSNKSVNVGMPGYFCQSPVDGLLTVDSRAVRPNDVEGHNGGGSYGTCQRFFGSSFPSKIGWGDLADDNTATLNSYLSAVCRNAKDSGVTIFTLTLSSDVSPTGKRVMRQCASGDERYYNVEDSGDLSAAFKDIAGSLTELRLIE